MLISLMGSKQAGKSSVARYLHEQHGFVRLSFAGPLKQICAATFDIPPEYFHSPYLKEHPHPFRLTEHSPHEVAERLHYLMRLSPKDYSDLLTVTRRVLYPVYMRGETTARELLQLVGTDIGRAIRDAMWVNLFRDEYNQLADGEDATVDDMRFPNEGDIVDALRGYKVRVQRDVADNQRDVHPSEQAWREIAPHYILHNNWDLSTLHEMTNILLWRIKYDQHEAIRRGCPIHISRLSQPYDSQHDGSDQAAGGSSPQEAASGRA